VIAVALFVVGMTLSALFSGSETGFYRVTRVRLLLDGLGGDRIARGLLWLTNHPALFVATTLIGNNLANYFVSLAIVIITRSLWSNSGTVIELLASVAMAPVVFIFGELLPKNLFFNAPNRLLRRVGPVVLGFVVLFGPLSALLWSLGRLVESLVGQGPLRLQLTLARRELQQLLEEGHAVGILRPAQRDLAHSLFAAASKRALDFSVPVSRVAAVTIGQDKAEVLRMARRHRRSVAPVVDPKTHELRGYVRIVDLVLDPSATIQETSLRELIEISSTETHIAALSQLQNAKEELARVIGKKGQVVGLLYADELTAPLLRVA